MSFIILAVIGLLVLIVIGIAFWIGFIATAVKGEEELDEKDDPPTHTRV